MSYFDDCSSDSENDADYVPDEEEPLVFYGIESELEKKTETSSDGNDVCGKEDIKTSIDQKKKADDLFKSFLLDVESEMKAKEEKTESISTNSGYGNASSSSAEPPIKENGKSSSDAASINTPEEKAKEFDFAGETVSVSVDGSISVSPEEIPTKRPVAKKKGLESVLGFIQNKKPKLSTLEKSKLDWQFFKKSEGIEEDLKKHNKGKGGFIERQRFLQRSDLRSYEIERDMRLSRIKKT